MTASTRFIFTLVIVLFAAAAAYVGRGSQAVIAAAAVLGLILVAAVWALGRSKAAAAGAGLSGSALELDKSVAKLIDSVIKNFDENCLTQAGNQAQKLIVLSLKGMDAGKIKNTKRAIIAFGKLPKPADVEQKRVTQIAISLATFYLMADENGDDGHDTVTRINNFISGVHDTTF